MNELEQIGSIIKEGGNYVNYILIIVVVMLNNYRKEVFKELTNQRDRITRIETVHEIKGCDAPFDIKHKEA